jgi:class 3 adenylate cyclase/tetratricopeptide (TPR) repeat protein
VPGALPGLLKSGTVLPEGLLTELIAAEPTLPAVLPVRMHDRLVPYVPRLLVEWLRDSPEARSMELDGTLAFVDISGFTSMTERLARKGKVGAEEMNDVLNALFAELLAVAYEDGAGLLKWGGDAVLLWFDGPEHAGLACHAAMNMQQTIRSVGRIATSVGRVTLRMSVGIHSGRFHFFLTGDPEIHRELVLAGPAATSTVLMEQTAEATEVAVSPATAALLDPSVLGPEKDEAILLGAAPRVAAEPAPPLPDLTGVEIARLVPAALREHLLLDDDQPEHRRITAAFLEFVGTDDLLAAEGAEAAGEAIDACVRAVQAAALGNEVAFFETDVSRNAWRVMLIAGAPLTPGQDEDRMLSTLRTVADAGLPLPVRIGTNAGHVFAGHFGPPFRKTYSVKGDAVNLSARLMAKADLGQILANSSVLDVATAVYETVPIEPFAAKGKRDLVHASSIGRRAGVKIAADELPLVGRDDELDALRTALSEAAGGNGAALELVGPPGIGKTRLLQELFALAPSFRVLRAICEPDQQQIAYRPFRAIVRAALEIERNAPAVEAAAQLRDRVAEVAPQLLPWLPLLGIVADVDVPPTQEVLDLGEDFRRRKLEDVTLEFLSTLLRSPTVLALDDAHYIDLGSASLLTRLAENVGRSPWVLVVTRRDETTGLVLPERDRCRSLSVEPLPPSDTEELIAHATEAAPLRRHDVEVLTARSAGNPLFLGQLLATAVATGTVGELPPTVESLVTAQIDRVPLADRRILRFASVLGMAFSEALVWALLDVEAHPPDPSAWLRLLDFVQGDGPGRLRFRHALMREAAYEGLPFRRRRELHARAGVMIIADAEDPMDKAELLSHHFFAAQNHFDAWAYSRIAGERALAKYANVEAAMFYTRAVDSGRRARVPPVELAPVYEDLGDVRFLLNEFDAARAAYAAGRRLVPDDTVTQGRFLLAEAKVHYRGGRFSDAIRSIRRGMRLLEDDPRRDARRMFARLGALYAGVRVSQGKYAEAELWCNRILAFKDEVGELEAQARAYYILDFVLMDQGRVDEAVHSARAADLFEQIGDLANQAEVISNSGADAYERGEWEQAIALHERSLVIRRRTADDGEIVISQANIAEIRLEQGHVEEAERLLRNAERTARAGAYFMPQAYISGLLGRAAALAGRFDEAAHWLDTARSIFERIGYRPQVFEIQVRLAELCALRGDGERALEETDESLRMAAEFGGIAARLPLVQRIRAFALAGLGRLAEARAALDESLAAARARRATHEIGLTLDALAQLDRLEGKEPDPSGLRESEEILGRLGIVHLPQLPAPVPAPA